MAHSRQNSQDKICEATFKLAAKQGWAALKLEDIALAAKTSLAQLRQSYSTKNHLLPALVAYVDRRVEASVGKIDMKVGVRDRLFEVLMARFDILQKNRAGILAIHKDMRREPALMRLILPAELQAMRQAMRLARLDIQSPCAQIVPLGLLGIYARCLWEWQRDTSQDMAKTMASLDKSLRYAGMAADILFRGRT